MAERRFLELVSFEAGSSNEHLSNRKWRAKFWGGVSGFTSTFVELEVSAGRKDDAGEYRPIPPDEALATAQRLATEFFLAVAVAGSDWLKGETRAKLIAAFPQAGQPPELPAAGGAHDGDAQKPSE